MLLPLSALVAAGCGGGQGKSAAHSSPAASSTTAAAPGPTASPSGATSASAPSAGSSQRPAPVESNPPGDIPDNVAYVSYRNAAGRYGFVHPEGWASVVQGATVTFTDKLNGITATSMSAAAAPTAATAKHEIAKLQSTQPAFELRSIKPASLPGGSGVLIVFRRNSAPDPVTGKVFRDEVNRYEVYRSGREVLLDLFGAVGSDNVDPYTKISQSLRLA